MAMIKYGSDEEFHTIATSNSKRIYNKSVVEELLRVRNIAVIFLLRNEVHRSREESSFDLELRQP